MKRTARTSPTLLDTHVTLGSRAWTRKLRTAAACARRAAAAAIDGADHAQGPPFRRTRGRVSMEISILLTTDQAVRRLNASFRGIDKPTNVLSFPAFSDGDIAPPAGTPVLLGDIAVAFGTTDREARAEGKTLAAHLSHLVVHGVLHLLGYDHQRDRDAMKMELLETEILAGLGIANPYAEASKESAPVPKVRPRRQKSLPRKRGKA